MNKEENKKNLITRIFIAILLIVIIVCIFYIVKLKKDLKNFESKNIDISKSIEENENIQNSVNENQSENLPYANYKNIGDIALDYRKGISGWSTGDKTVKNYAEFNYDLNGDGNIETIRFEAQEDEFYPGDVAGYNTYVNGNLIDETPTPFCAIYIVDLNKNDNLIDIAIFDDGPSDDPNVRLYSMNGSEVTQLICFETWLFNSENDVFKCDENGNVIANNRLNAFLTPEYYDNIYYVENGVLTDKYVEVEPDILYSLSNSHDGLYFTEDLNNLNKFFEYLNENENVEYDKALENCGIINVSNKNLKFNIYEFTDTEEMKVKLEDGTEGYIFNVAGHLAD